jgi:hypothetical protein
MEPEPSFSESASRALGEGMRWLAGHGVWRGLGHGGDIAVPVHFSPLRAFVTVEAWETTLIHAGWRFQLSQPPLPEMAIEIARREAESEDFIFLGLAHGPLVEATTRALHRLRLPKMNASHALVRIPAVQFTAIWQARIGDESMIFPVLSPDSALADGSAFTFASIREMLLPIARQALSRSEQGLEGGTAL